MQTAPHHPQAPASLFDPDAGELEAARRHAVTCRTCVHRHECSAFDPDGETCEVAVLPPRRHAHVRLPWAPATSESEA